MITYNVFKGRRGEGKTKWLCEQLMNYMTNGEENIATNFVYVGNYTSFQLFKEAFRREFGIPCPLKHYKDKRDLRNEVYFTDELTQEIPFFDFNHMPVKGLWYITMDTEVFVN